MGNFHEWLEIHNRFKDIAPGREIRGRLTPVGAVPIPAAVWLLEAPLLGMIASL